MDISAAAKFLRFGPFQILRLLLERQGGVVTRDELQQGLRPRGAARIERLGLA